MKISPLRIAFSALASLAMATSANAASLQFFQQNLAQTPIVSSNPSSGTTTLTTTGPGAVGAIPPGWIQVQILLEGQIQTQPAFMSFTTALTSGGAASTSGTSITQDGYTGTIQFRSLPTTVGSINFLTATFNGGLLTGTAGGGRNS